MSLRNLDRDKMMKQILLCILLACAFDTTRTCDAAEGDPGSGKALFTKIGCFQCHGYVGQGGVAGARIALPAFPVQFLIQYVRRPTGEMPAYAEKVVSDQDLTDIYAYLKSVPPAKDVKDIPLLMEMKNSN
jgi:ubiquinol-cytochrome c reductase cytochrome c subunit